MNELLAIERSEIEEQIHPLLIAAQNFVICDDATCARIMEFAKIFSARIKEAAQVLIVYDAETYVQAMEYGKICSDTIKFIEDMLGPAQKKPYYAYRQAMQLMNAFIEPLKTAKELPVDRAYAWQKADEERKRREAEEARRRAKDEAATKLKAEEDARLALASRMEKEGMVEQAEEMLVAPINIEVTEVAPPTPKVKVEGTSFAECWQGKVVNAKLIPPEYTMPDLVKLNATTKLLKGNTYIPGWEVFDVGSARFQKQK